MENSIISFKSNIRLASANKYTLAIADIPSKLAVNPPWTAKEIVSGQKAYTTKIYDCIAGGITDGEKVVMFHICPTYEANDNFGLIEKTVMDNFKGKTQSLRGLILGNKPEFDASNNMLEHFKNFMKKNNVDFSILGGLKFDDESSIAYDVKSDTWTITNNYISEQIKKGVSNLRGILERTFKEVHLSKNDTLARN